MRYLYSAMEAKEVDHHAIHTIGIPGLVLMEKAAMTVAAVLIELGKQIGVYNQIRILAVCGTGNNGGDGVAVARILHEQGYQTAITVIGQTEHMTEDMKKQMEIAVNCEVPVLSANSILEENFDIILDGLFGIGLSRPIEGVYAEMIERINKSPAMVVALDVPSGVHVGTGEILGTAIRAEYTVTFGVNKIGLVMFPGCECAGEIIVGDIGFPRMSCRSVNPGHYFYEKDDLLTSLPPRKKHSHKGSYGKVLIVAGCETMAGAACLAAKAAYASGAGLVRVLSSECNRDILLEYVPEILFTGRGEKMSEEQLREIADWADSIVIGPGLGLSAESERIVRFFVEYSHVPTVIDGDGIRLCRRVTDGLAPNFILTPHVKEMSVLTDISVQKLTENLIDTTRKAAKKWNCIIAQKDARTVVSDGDECYINVSGNQGMATGGAGDVLAGIIGGLLGQHAMPFEAAKTGVFWHGLSGDVIAAEKGTYSLMASDLIDGMSKVVAELKRKDEKRGVI